MLQRLVPGRMDRIQILQEDLQASQLVFYARPKFTQRGRPRLRRRRYITTCAATYQSCKILNQITSLSSSSSHTLSNFSESFLFTAVVFNPIRTLRFNFYLVRSMNSLLKLAASFLFLLVSLYVRAQIKIQPIAPSIDSVHAAGKIEHDLKRITPGQVRSKTTKPVAASKNVFSFQRVSNSQSGTCYDTSRRSFVKNDSIILYNSDVYQTADGNLLIPGGYGTRYGPYHFSGFLMKCDPKGNVIWARQYDSANHAAKQFGQYSHVIELKDGSLILAGRFSNPTTENDDVVITKTNSEGSIIWNKVYKSRLWARGNSSRSYYSIENIQEDPYTGDVFLCGGFWNEGRSLTRINVQTGAIVWSNLYQYSNSGYQVFDRSFGVDFLAGEIRFFGKFGARSTFISVHRIKRENGDTLQSKVFRVDDPEGWQLEFLNCERIAKRANGNYLLSGYCYDTYPITGGPPTRPLAHAAVVEFDRDLNFVSAYAFKNQIASNVYNTRLSCFPDGSGVFTMLNWKGNYRADVFYVQFKDGFITKQRRMPYDANPGERNAVRLPDGGDLSVKFLSDSTLTSFQLEFLNMHPSDTSSLCSGYDDEATFVYPFRYVPDFYPLDSIGKTALQENPERALTAKDFTPEVLPGCYQVSHCDTLKLVATKNIICLGETLSLLARKNEGCGTLVPLSYDPSAVEWAIRQNDSTVSFRFKRAWSGYIYASLQGCSLMRDSVYVSVLNAPSRLELGPDRSLCPGNSIRLNARNGYATYLWQDGSIDSTFNVTAPGLYYVTTTDACGGVFKDSVIVTAAPPIAFSVGPDRTKCNQDTLHLSAPSGFLNYAWSNPYNISSTTSQTVVVSPLVDTAYYVRGEKTPGCFAYDTVRIKVFTSPTIDLGADKSFCLGDSALFSAPNGFISYLWSSGETSTQIVKKAAGSYSVIGTTVDGCKSYDTVKVVRVYPLPVVNLDKTASLCFGASKTLHAGSYASYQWSTGEITPTITINDIGRYNVRVSDVNGCNASDSTEITTIHPLPAGFLPPDTAVCSYGTLELKPLSNYSRYLWSSGGNFPNNTISKAGVYWLEVTDGNGCKGRDTVIVNPKDCMKGFYAPSAFSPNGDRKNDDFKPLLFGNVKKYQFTIFNRWGQVIFQTTEQFRGWDGKVAGVEQRSDVFAWTCTYQLEGEEVKTEKGTVLIVR